MAVAAKDVENVDYADLNVEELRITTSVLLAGAHHLGQYCKEDNTAFMKKRFDTNDPRQTLAEGRKVTECARNFFLKLKENCNGEFTKHWKCLDYNNQQYGDCRNTQKTYDACVLEHFGMESIQLDAEFKI